MNMYDPFIASNLVRADERHMQVKDEFQKILDAQTGNPDTPFNVTPAASGAVAEGINAGITYVSLRVLIAR